MPQVNGRFVPDMKSPRTPDNEEPAAERAWRFPPRRQGFHRGNGTRRGRALHGLQKAVLRRGLPR